MNEINDRLPTWEVPERIEDTLDLNLEENQEDYKGMMEMVEKIKTMGRASRRQILKPHFTNGIKETFRKQQLAKITAKKVV